MTTRHQRRRTRRLKIFGSLLGASLFVAGAFGAWRYYHTPHTEELFTAAEAARHAGKLKDAVINYKNVLQREPERLDARWRLGQVYLALGQAAAAIKELEAAEPLRRQYPELALDLIKARLATHDFAKALADLAAVPGAETPELVALKAQAKLGLGEPQAAKEILAAASAKNSTDPSLHLATAKLALSQKDFDGAATAVAAALALDPNRVDALQLSGQIALFRGHPNEAESSYRRALEHATDKIGALAGLAEALLAQGKIEPAALTIKDLVVAAPKMIGTRYLQGWLAYAKKDWAQTELMLVDVLKAAPKHPQGLLMMADATFRQGKLNQAEANIRTFDGNYPGQPAAAKLLGAILLKQGRAQDALTALSPLVTANPPDPGAIALLSYAYFAVGDTKKGSDFLAQAQALAPESSLLQAQGAMGEILGGKSAEGISELEKMAARDPTSATPRQLLTYAHLLQGAGDAALESAQALVVLRPQDPMAYNLLGIARLKANARPAARQAFEKAVQLDAKFAPALANLGLLALADKDLDHGRQQLEAALKADPAYTSAALALAALNEHEGKIDAAVKVLQDAAAANPRATTPRWLLAGRLLNQGQRDAALKMAEQAYSIAPRAIPNRLQWAKTLLVAGRVAEAQKVLTSMHQDAPTLDQATMLLAESARLTGDTKAARGYLGEVLQTHPNDIPALLGSFAVELKAHDYAAANAFIARLRTAEPDQPLADNAAAELAIAQGKHAEALQILRAVHAKAPTRASVMRLSDALQADGKASAATQELSNWVSAHPTDNLVRQTLGSLRLASGDLNDARAQFEAVLKTAPADPVALNNLAWIYDRAGDSRAVDYAERAHTALPNNPETADTLGWILVQHKEVQRGLKLVEQAHALSPAEPTIAYHYAHALAEAGAKDKARDLLTSVLKDGREFEAKNDAKALLRRLSQNTDGVEGLLR